MPKPVGNAFGKPRRKRSLVVTLLGMLIGLGGLVLTPISVISLMMIIAGSYGTQTSDPLGFFLVIVAPPLTALAGLGFVLRWRWAWLYAFVACFVVLAWQGWELTRPPSPPPTTTYSPSGVRMTTIHSGPQVSIPAIAIATGLLVLLVTPRVRRDFGMSRRENPPPLPAELPLKPGVRQWRVGHEGRDRMFYEEWRDGTWHRLAIDGEMLTGRAHHVIYFPTPETWATAPEWARERREEIVSRIKSEFREPDYEYQETAAAVVRASVVPGPAAAAAPAPLPPTTAAQRWALALVLVILLAFAGWMAWIVKDGIDKGEVRFFAGKGTMRRMVVREKEPVMFHVSVGLYAAVGAGTLGLFGWGLVFVARDASSGRRPGRD